MKTAALLGLLLIVPWMLAPDGEREDAWLTDLDAAHALAAKVGKPMLVGFR